MQAGVDRQQAVAGGEVEAERRDSRPQARRGA
jgi:hypothetical protein